MVKNEGVRELATMDQLEDRIRKLEERILMHNKAIKRLFDLFQGAMNTQPKQSREERLKTESNERLNRIMKELGYEID